MNQNGEKYTVYKCVDGWMVRLGLGEYNTREEAYAAFERAAETDPELNKVEEVVVWTC